MSILQDLSPDRSRIKSWLLPLQTASHLIESSFSPKFKWGQVPDQSCDCGAEIHSISSVVGFRDLFALPGALSLLHNRVDEAELRLIGSLYFAFNTEFILLFFIIRVFSQRVTLIYHYEVTDFDHTIDLYRAKRRSLF